MLMPSVHDAVAALLSPLSSQSCLLLVGREMAALSGAAAFLVVEHHWPLLGIGGDLARALLPEPESERPRMASRWLVDRLRALAPGPAVCTGIDLLFEPSLSLDPLALFVSAARQTRLVVAWPGSFAEGRLSYAAPGHGHYKTWREPDALICTI